MDPPDAAYNRARGSAWQDALLTLKASPEKWALLGRYRNRGIASAKKSAFQTGRTKTPAGKWEFVTRKLFDNNKDLPYALFGRYIGPEEGKK